MKKIFQLLLPVFCIMYCSCEENSNSSYEQFLDKIATYQCERFFECCNKAPENVPYTTEEACIEYERAQAAENMIYIKWTNLVIDQENADKCFQYVKDELYGTYDCTERITITYNTFDTQEHEENELACRNILQGTVERGDTCHIIQKTMGTGDVITYDECKKGLYCSEDTFTCKNIPSTGEECDASRGVCDQQSKKHMCIEEKRNGDVFHICKVIPYKDGDRCLENKYCDEGLSCKQETDPDTEEKVFICRESIAKMGADCSEKSCEAGSFCDVSKDPPVCAQLKENGKSCTDDQECISLTCSMENDKGSCVSNNLSPVDLLCPEDETPDDENRD